MAGQTRTTRKQKNKHKTIFYAFSDDLQKNDNLWHESKTKLPERISHCSCLIMDKSRHFPNLLVFGGETDYDWMNLLNLLPVKYKEYSIFSDILDFETYINFRLNGPQVNA